MMTTMLEKARRFFLEGDMGIIVDKSKEMMRRSFEKTIYRFDEAPRPRFSGEFGVYVHVPFCRTKCSFCPFYKELYSEEMSQRYVEAICKEIDSTDMEGSARWVYFGGGTPNLLSTEELGHIVEHLSNKVKLKSLGIEALPALLDENYLDQLSDIGFGKLSIGVESFADEPIEKAGRMSAKAETIGALIEQAKSLGMWVNTDLIVGLDAQTPDTFFRDIETAAKMVPSQVTIYPYMLVRGLNAAPSMSEKKQFSLIEEACNILELSGYHRRGVWTLTSGNDIYDSSRDELVDDYAGFGPAAFSTYGNWKVVNPHLDVYLANQNSASRKCFVAPKTRATQDWRNFARMIYDLSGKAPANLPAYIRAYIGVLRATGYIERNRLTTKGRHFAHAITKVVVESLPFPVQNPTCVENYEEYTRYRKDLPSPHMTVRSA